VKVVLSYEAGADHLAALRAAAPGAELEVVASEHRARAEIVDADAFLGNRFFVQSAGAAGRLRWMQSGSMGVDEILTRLDRAPWFVLTRVRNCYEAEVAEHAIALLLAAVRRIDDFALDRRDGVWRPRSLTTLGGQTAIVLGLGGIGREVAPRLHGLGIHVVGVRAHHSGRPAPTAWGEICGPDSWRARLPEARALVLALPRTPETRHLVGADELATLPEGAAVVNVGRGGTLDDAAIAAAAASGRLVAGLDVTEQEPLPRGHPLWSARGLVLTPHVGRSREAHPRRWEPLFVENLRRFHRNEPLLHVVDPARGY
jgi:phosphoglycerate dehydrogenase-like enzyme